MSAETDSIRVGSVVSGPTLPEPVEVLAIVPMGESLKLIGRGRNSGMTHDPVLTPAQIAVLTVSADREPFDGDARMFRPGVEAQRLGLAYDYDPFYSLSIRCRISLRPFTATSCGCHGSGFCLRTIREPARRSWRGCFSRN